MLRPVTLVPWQVYIVMGSLIKSQNILDISGHLDNNFFFYRESLLILEEELVMYLPYDKGSY